MASIESILQLIVDRPGLTANEIADEVDLVASDVQSRLVKHIESGKVKKDLKAVDGGRTVFTYFPGQSLIQEVDGVKRATTTSGKTGPKPQALPGAASDFTFGFFSNGTLSISKGSKEIRLTRAEASQMIDFLDAINIEKIAGA
ncbi:hypothetical protein B0G76_2880 [Paraburkholderia sp. BL23I1N1]|uniref:hypothetical protein n=1 Tax=Paraburkholderia sp. BL23I1N1 TaxID=1938802 RepID=UPI000E753217|nr:hypothetical protein [Paraburkholderia sp. BL23I1N1]RKE36678.1 hypothetical protein B0G76_2880 [Paraburkholderia sp. BL23I1N1]